MARIVGGLATSHIPAIGEHEGIRAARPSCALTPVVAGRHADV